MDIVIMEFESYSIKIHFTKDLLKMNLNRSTAAVAVFGTSITDSIFGGSLYTTATETARFVAQLA
jgi:hypothetical protein